MTASKNGETTPNFADYVTIHGDLDELNDLFSEEIVIATGKNRQDKFWKNTKSTIANFMQAITTHNVGDKDGLSFMQGELVTGDKRGTQRLANNVKSLEILVLDLDTGQPIESVREKIIEAGLFAVIYTTHSHNGTTTDVSKQDVIAKMKIGEDEEVKLVHVKKYLELFKKFDKKVIDSITDFTEDHVEGGIKYFVDHIPMPKYRVIFFLNKPFVISKVAKTQREAIELWKKKYAGAANMVDAYYDRSCVDPSRLFYFPRHGKGKAHHVEIIVGDLLDLSEIIDGNVSGPALSGASAFIEAGRGSDDTRGQNAWVKGWWYRNKAGFMAADFATSYYEERLRKSGDKVSVVCPNDSGHSDAGNPDDTGFFCVNAGSEGPEGDAFMKCMHASCANHFGERANASWPYLDLMVTDLGLTEEDLDQYVEEFQDTNEGPTPKDGKKEPEVPEISDEEYDNLTVYEQYLYDISRMDKTDRARDRMLRAMVKSTRTKKREDYLDSIYVEELTGAMSKRFGLAKNLMVKAFQRIKAEVATEEAEEKAEGIEINIRADFEDQIKWATQGISEANDPPRLFKLEDGQTMVRVNYTPGAGQASKRILDSTMLFSELSDLVRFYRIEGEDKRRVNSAAPAEVVKYFSGATASKIPLPTLTRIIKHPIFTFDGDYHVKNGYDLTSSAFLDMNFKPIKLPKRITEDDLQDAWDWLFAAPGETDVNDEQCGLFGEFPFCDEDDDSGTASRINWLSCMLQPLVRDMIGGPTPMYLIDKPTAGSGSSLMATLMNRILTGDAVPMTQYKSNMEEFEKLLVSKLMNDSDGVMYYDNVNVKVDNGTLASAITSGVFSGRILGSSNQVKLPIRHVWMISGNNVTFSDEMIRRLIPIRLDAKHDAPADRANFAIKYPERWVVEHRERLFWALCIFVQNWVDRSMKHGSGSLGSFEEWAGVMSGIMEAADIGDKQTGFLTNLRRYRDSQKIDNDDDVRLLVEIRDVHGINKPFSAGDMFNLLWDDDEKDLEISLPLRGTTKASKKISFGMYLRKIKDRKYAMGVDEQGRKVTGGISLHPSKTNGVAHYVFDEKRE